MVEHNFAFIIPPQEKLTHSEVEGSGRPSTENKVLFYLLIAETGFHSDKIEPQDANGAVNSHFIEK